MISPISGATSGAAGIDFATYMQKVREHYGSRSQPQAAAKATGKYPTENTLSITDLTQSELETLEPTGAQSFARRFTAGGSLYVQRIWWG
jgi:hypothetical protein